MGQPTRACLDCGGDISSRQHNALRCGPCAKRHAPWDVGKRRTTYDHVCPPPCGKAFRSRVKGQVHCSPRCSGLASTPEPTPRVCAACAEPFVGRTDTCSRVCYAWARHYPGVPMRTRCGYCSGPIVGRTKAAMYCSRLCAAMTMIGRRRANKLGRPVERIRPRDIFERDGWVCHICADPIDRDLRGHAPGAPTLDHLIPVSHPDYPGHITANVAASHWVCNTSKGNRLTSHDLALHQRLLAELPPGDPVRRHAWSGPGPRTHCIHGHEFTEENTYWRPDGGGRVCRRCSQDRGRKRHAREDAATRDARLVGLRARYGAAAAT